jgi:hypothetical protein
MTVTRQLRLLLLTIAGLAAVLAIGACGSDDDDRLPAPRDADRTL